MALKCLTLLGKNFRSYTRLEIIIYLLLPLLMLHLVWLRCKPNHENPVHCFSPRDGLLGDNTKLNPLYNSLESVADGGPVKKLLLYSNENSMADKLKPALNNILKLRNVIQVKSEADMANYLVNGNYLGGILWKVDGNNTKVTIRFPSSLRTSPTQVWETDKKEVDSNLPSSYYSDEGFLQIINSITAFLSQPDLSKSAYDNKDNGVTISSNPFHFDDKYKKDLNRKLSDQIKSSREYIFPFYLGILYIYPFIRLIMHMSREKARQQVDLMNIARSNRFLHYYSWFLATFIVLTMINVLTIFLLTAPFCENGNVLNCSSFTALLFFFTIWSVCGICFCFLVYSLIHHVVLAAFVVAFFCILGFLLFSFLQSKILIERYFLCILLQYAFLAGLERILYFEYFENTGLQWYHIYSSEDYFQSSLGNEDLSYYFGDILVIMGIVAILSLFICILVELIFPGKYGISKCRRSRPDSRFDSLDSSAIVEANNLRKFQKKKAPLKHFTMNMYDDQITVILGLSDSGKSAIVHLISRSIPPDSGYVKIDNKDVIRNPGIRFSLGLAPQHNALFPNLTVKQHTNFYSSLRRSSGKKFRNHSMEKYLRALDLWNVKDVKSRNLSEADKKKLAVACAFCGNPRIILLDEPSEGLEPCERRLLWDVLQTEKRCRTIIVTTYHIEEADVLADRVAILCDGQLIFNGSSVFLKNSYGSGYQLVYSQGEIYQEEQITSLVSKYVPDSSASCDNACEMAYNIPQSCCRGIVPLLKELERSGKCGNMDTIQIGTTPIIEKYVNATSTCCDGLNKSCNMCSIPEKDNCLVNGRRLCSNQWKAMTLKKFYHIKHNCLLFFLLPLLLLMAFAGLLTYFYGLPDTPKYYNEGSRDTVSQKRLKLNLDSYGSSCSYALVKNENKEHPLIPLLKRKISGCTAEEISNEDLKNGYNLNDKYVFALKMDKCDYQIFFSRKWLHSEAVAASLMAYLANGNLLDKYCSGYGKAAEMPMKNIDFYNHPYPSRQHYTNHTFYEVECRKSGALYILLLSLSIFTGFFAAYIIRERIIGYKLMQQVEGINMATFWLSHLLWDWLWLSLFSVLLVILMSVILRIGFIDESVAYMIALLFFNLAQLLFLYLLMQLFECTIFGWIIPIILLLLLAIPFELGAPDFPFGILYLIPIYTALALLHSICIEAAWHRFCDGKNPNLYKDCENHPHWSSIWAGLPYIAILFCLAILYFILLLLYEKGFPCKRKRRTGTEEELNRMTRNEIRNHTLFLDSVKSNKSRRPIKDIFFGLRTMDVVGLVGERSGKTTLNKSIISQNKLSRGHIYVKGIDVQDKKVNQYRAFKYIGYCPQENYFESRFTGRENLRIFSLIRGIRSYKVRDVSEELAENLNFREHLDKTSKKYTVSDKRKLSTAIAVTGTPPLIILDEPTAGVEKAHRADVLDVLRGVNDCGSSILLSSNNIEDFQAVCNRLALMKRGKLVAIGPIESFKNQSAHSLILMVKARPHAMCHQLGCGSSHINKEAIINIITRFLLSNFGSVYLLEEIQGDMLFYIHNTSIPLAKAFQLIEQNRHELYISDFYLKHEDMELSFVTQNFRILR